MKTMQLVTALFFTIILMVQTAAAGDNKALADEVMAIHDVAMAKMTHMHELKLQLKELEKSTETTAAITGLEHAHRGMMQWMREYKIPRTAEEWAQARPYLLEEKSKIEAVADAINTSIQEAEKLLK